MTPYPHHIRPRQLRLPQAVLFCAAGIDAAGRICYAEKEQKFPLDSDTVRGLMLCVSSKNTTGTEVPPC